MSEEELYKQYLQETGQAEAPKAVPNDEELYKQYLTEHGSEEKPKEKSVSQRLETALKGFGQGASQGYMPQLQAALVEPVTKPLVNAYLSMIGEKGRVPDDTYVQRRDENVKNLARLQKEDPVSFGGGQVAGALTSGLAIPGGAAMKAASLPMKMLAGGGTAATMMSLQNPGDVEGKINPIQMDERIQAAQAPGMLLDMPGGAVLENSLLPGIAHGIEKTPAALRSMAETQAFKALGPYARSIKQAFAKGKINKIGGTLLDEGAIKNIPTDFETLGKRTGEMATKKYGEKIDYMKDLQENVNKSKSSQTLGVSRKDLAKKMREELIESDTTIPDVARENDRFDRLIKQFEKGDDEIIDVLKAEKMKEKVGSKINWDRIPGADIPDTEVARRSLYNKLMGGVEEAATAMEKEGGRPAGEFKKIKDTYGNLAESKRIANNKANAEFAKGLLSPTDYISLGLGGTLGAATSDESSGRGQGGVLGSLSLLAANKLQKNYGAQFLAKQLNNASKATKVVTPTISKALSNPWANAAVLQQRGMPDEQ